MQLTENNYNVKVNIDSEDGVVSVKLKRGRCNKSLESQPHCIWKYVRGWLKQKDEDDKKTKLEGSVEKMPTCTEVGMMQGRENRLVLVKVVTPCPLELHIISDGHYHCKPCRILHQNHIW